jgi:hypothetical protein
MKLFGSPLSDFIAARNENLPDFRKYNWFGAYGEAGHYTQFREERTRIIQRSLSVFWNVREQKCTRAVRQ